MVIEMAATNGTPQDCEKLKMYLNQQEERIDEEDDSVWIELDIGFHLMILDFTRNPFLIDIGKTVYELYRNLKQE